MQLPGPPLLLAPASAAATPNAQGTWRELPPALPPDAPRSKALETTRAITMSVFSRQWSGWASDPDKLAAGVTAWWQAQTDQYGPYDFIQSGPPLARFVGDIEGSPVVDRDVCFGTKENGWTKVTYRFLLTQAARDAEATGPRPATRGRSRT